jgi:hypothetical protein
MRFITLTKITDCLNFQWHISNYGRMKLMMWMKLHIYEPKGPVHRKTNTQNNKMQHE